MEKYPHALSQLYSSQVITFLLLFTTFSCHSYMKHKEECSVI